VQPDIEFGFEDLSVDEDDALPHSISDFMSISKLNGNSLLKAYN
jgi:hypothetical protein